MSKIYIISAGSGKAVILEAKSTKAAKSAYQSIKKAAPGVSMAVYGAKDLNTFRRSHRTLPPARLTTSVEDFVKNLDSLTHA
jgi:hypothetical protein